MPDKRGKDLPEMLMALKNFLGCPCHYFAPMDDDTPIVDAYRKAVERGRREGFVPVLVAEDETLWECLVMNSDKRKFEPVIPMEEGMKEDYAYHREEVEQYRQDMLGRPVQSGKEFLENLLAEYKREAEEDGLEWEYEIRGEIAGGEKNDALNGYWNFRRGLTCPLVMAEIPVKNPWEIFAYLPFGGWNECPDTPELMAVAKYWYECYGAMPVAITHDVLEFMLPVPVGRDNVGALAQEQYVFCPDVIDQGPHGTVSVFADALSKSIIWYFWWD